MFFIFSNKTYAEIHLRVNANSVEYFLEEGKEKASVECILIVTDGNKNSVYADKFVLNASSENGKRILLPKKILYPARKLQRVYYGDRLKVARK